MTLNELNKGSKAVVSALLCEEQETQLARRLFLMGIRPGVELEMVGKAPFGDPYVIRIQHHGFGLRTDLAKLIEVTPCD